MKEGDEKFEDEIIFDILFWVIFVNWKELVEICWFRVENYLCMCYNIFVKRLLYSVFLKKLINFLLISFVYCYKCFINFLNIKINYIILESIINVIFKIEYKYELINIKI